ncbi:MAG: alpha/beta fold hydrolase [Phycisphaera sp.]|nr:MAG: alpha/beta fold hydrolase [Phycisphaera sp.]
MQIDVMNWSLPGADGQTILGNTHLPEGTPRAAAIIAHGFLGYKDYGFFPTIADTLARIGIAAHRFNLSHSGMTNEIDTFARPDLFAKNTWNKQVEDIERLIHALDRHELVGPGIPVLLVGHSRGGVASLLCAGRRAAAAMKPLEAIVTIAAPDSTSRESAEQRELLEKQGYLVVTSGRTGQTLQIDRAFWDEQHAEPGAHELLTLAEHIPSPTLVIHGDSDPTVPPGCAQSIAGAIPNAKLAIIEGGDHVLNTPNPFPVGAEPSAQLKKALDYMTDFVESTLSAC